MTAVDAWHTVFPLPVHNITVESEDEHRLRLADEVRQTEIDREEMERFVFDNLASYRVEEQEEGVTLIGDCEQWVSAMEWDSERERFDDCGDYETVLDTVATAESEFHALAVSDSAVLGHGLGDAPWFDKPGVPFADIRTLSSWRRTLLVSLHDLRSGMTLDDLTDHYVAVATILFAAGITDTREWRKTSEERIPVEYLAEVYRPVA